jgi:DNA-binding transcriptional regulator YhcF (GntR family)
MPVFLQIKNKLKSDILSGVYKPGERIPTVRQIALDVSVNPNTVQRALFILEDEGLIVTEATTGKFVTEDEGKIAECRRAAQMETLNIWLDRIHSLGITNEDIIEFIERGTIK